MKNGRNSDRNSALSPKLGWVHQVHTQQTLAAHTAPRPRAHCAVSWRAVCRVVGLAPAMSQACRTVSHACPAVSWPISRHSQRPSRALCRDPQGRSPSRNTICIATLPGQSTLLSRYKRLYRDTPQRPGRSTVTIQLIVS